MLFKSYFKFLPVFGLFATVALVAQMAPVVTIAPQPTVKVKRGTPATVTLKVSLPAGFHMNSNTPTEPNLIPLTLKWTGGPLEGAAITYPKPLLETYTFTAGKPISVVTGTFDVTTKFQVPATAATGRRRRRGRCAIRPATIVCVSHRKRFR